MKIGEYSFGKIIIDNKKYSSDVVIFPDHVKADWRRKKGHLLQLDDIQDILAHDPKTVIIGTGAFGLMKIDKEVKAELKQRNIELIYKKTNNAIEKYNQINNKNIIAGLHLTC